MSDSSRRAAARAAITHLPRAGVVGLGTGSTARAFIDELAILVRGGRDLVGVPTSEITRRHAIALGIPLLADDGPWDIDLCVDGADEVSPERWLLKGGGGALLREKIVNEAARRNVIIVEDRKLSSHLCERSALPVEVIRFGHAQTARELRHFGMTVERRGFLTDAGNVIYDLHCGPIDSPSSLERTLLGIPGVVETGLFIGRADVILIADTNGGVRAW